MSHTIYNTNAIVLKRVATGEADVTLWLLTEELGLIVARAQSARKELGKMRGYLQLFAILRVSLVRGRHVWRVTGTESTSGLKVDDIILSNESLSTFARIARFVRRMIMTNSAVATQLFEILLQARIELTQVDATVKVERVELVCVAQILSTLGYLEQTMIEKAVAGEIEYNDLAKMVNMAVSESHL